MAILVFQHHVDEPPCVLGTKLRDLGHKLRTVRLFAGDAVPADLDDVDGIVSMGGPMNVDEAAANPWIPAELALLKAAHEAKLPIVGVCLGAQLLAAALGGEVGAMPAPEIGWGQVQLGFPGTVDPVYAGIPWKTTQFHAHGQEVKKLPPGATPLSGSKACKTQSFKMGYRAYGFQYHFEWTARDMEAQLRLIEKTATDGGFGAGTDFAAIRGAMEASFPMYRHLGDRLCDNIATLLFAIDKRLGHHATIEPVANFHAAQS